MEINRFLHIGWSNIKQLIVVLGIGFCIFIFGYVTDINSLQNKLRQTRKQKIELSRLLENKNQEVPKIKTVSKKTMLPVHDFNVTDVLNNLERAALNSQVELQLLEPQIVREEEFFTIYPVKLEIYGQYKKLLKFINYTLKQPCFTSFEELTLQNKATDDGSNELIMQALLTIYKNKIPTENTTRNSTINLSERDVFTKALDKTNLFLWSDQELHFLGFVKQNHNIYGFVSDPLGGIHRVTVGDKIYLKQRRIIAIDDHGITTANS